MKREKEIGRGGERRKKQRKLIPHSYPPSVDSTLLTSARLIVPSADRAGDSGCRANRDEAPAVASCLCCHDIASTWSGGIEGGAVTSGDR